MKWLTLECRGDGLRRVRGCHWAKGLTNIAYIGVLRSAPIGGGNIRHEEFSPDGGRGVGGQSESGSIHPYDNSFCLWDPCDVQEAGLGSAWPHGATGNGQS